MFLSDNDVTDETEINRINLIIILMLILAMLNKGGICNWSLSDGYT